MGLDRPSKHAGLPRRLFRGRRLASIAAGAVALTGISMMATAPRASASPLTPPNMFITVTTDFYAYVPAGGSLDLDLHVQASAQPAPGVLSNPARSTLRLVAIAPSGAQTVIDPGLAHGVASDLRLTRTLTDATPGVWKIAFFGGTPAVDLPLAWWNIDGVAAGVNYAADSAITPRTAGGTGLTGQVWAEQTATWVGTVVNGAPVTPPSGVTSQTLFHLNERGLLYRTHEAQLNGIQSTTWTDNYGAVTRRGSCERQYRSTLQGGPYNSEQDLTTWAAGCEGYMRYRLFYERPNPAMPATAQWFDGRTSNWVYPRFENSGMGDAISYTATRPTEGSEANWMGSFSAELQGRDGTLVVQIDTNGNGAYTDPVDVTTTLEHLNTGTVSVPWDGKDGQGAAVPMNRPIKVRFTWDVPSEIHFGSADVETRLGGIEIEMLEGPNPGDKTVHWDDTALLGTQGAGAVIPSPVSTGGKDAPGVDSTGGVHRWGGGSPTWGDAHWIEDYTFFEETAQREAEFVPGITIDKTSDADGELLPGGVVNYQVQLRNTGNVDLLGQRVSDDLMGVLARADLVTDSWSSSSGAVAWDADTESLVWTGDLPIGSTVTVDYRVQVKDAALVTDGDVINTACLAGWTSPEGVQLCDAVTNAVDFPALSFDLRKMGLTTTGATVQGLTGAVFELRADNDGALGEIATRTVVDDATHSTTRQNVTVDAVPDEAGVYRVMSMAPGRYWLVETKAPVGYGLMAVPVCLDATATRVADAWQISLTLCPDQDDALISAPAAVPPGSGLDGSFAFDVTNVAQLTLPNTGGSGRAVVALMGLLVLGGSAGAALRLRRGPGHAG